MRLPRGALRDATLVVGAAVALVALFAVLRRLGLPFGLRVGPMSEDYNWLLILRAPDPVSQAQAFWAIDGRNPLSPWWYVVARPLYDGFPNGPFLTRLAINPLLAASTYAAARAMEPSRNRAVALASGLVVGLWSFGEKLDQIQWNFLGALSLSLLSVAAFQAWLAGGRQSGGLYGLSLCLWFAAFATYLFQVGAIAAIGLLSLAAHLRTRPGVAKAVGRTAAEIAPFALLLAMFLLVWATSQNPLSRGAFALKPDLLLANLPSSVAWGLWPARYRGYAPEAFSGLGIWLFPAALSVGAIVALLVRSALPPAGSPWPQPGGVLALGCCIAVPTALVESMSVIWTVGSRWRMVDQVWQPLLWLGLAWLLAGRLPRLRAAFPAFAGLLASVVFALSLGHDHLSSAVSANAANLRREVTALVDRHGGARTLHLVVLVTDGVWAGFPDNLSTRVENVWLGDKAGNTTLRVLYHGDELPHPSYAPWWNIVLEDDAVRNVAIGGGDATYEGMVFARFDGRQLTVLDQLTKGDLSGQHAEWRRSRPLDLGAASKAVRELADRGSGPAVQPAPMVFK